MSDELKLLKCGCGGKARIYDTHFWGKVYFCECEKCGISTQPETTEAEAVEAWNRAMGGRTAKVEVIQCKDCKWWDRLEDGHPYGDCRACRSGTHTERWDINIQRQCKFDFYCADAEPIEEEEEEEDEEDA